MSEGFAAQDQGLRGLFCLVHLVSRGLGILHLSQLHFFAHTVKLLLGVLELANIPGKGVKMVEMRRCQIRRRLHIYGQSSLIEYSLLNEGVKLLLDGPLSLVKQNL